MITRATIGAGAFAAMGAGVLVARALEYFPRRDGSQMPWLGVIAISALLFVMAGAVWSKRE